MPHNKLSDCENCVSYLAHYLICSWEKPHKPEIDSCTGEKPCKENVSYFVGDITTLTVQSMCMF